ncbi:MAG: N-acetyltransferase family protein [Pseudomonadota bacterium]
MIRPAETRDLDAVQAIYADAVLHGTASFEIDPPDLSEITRRWKDVHAAKLPYVVADEGGQVAGYAYAAPYRPRPAYRFTAECSVYVDPAHGGRGLGSALMAEVIAQTEAAGYRQMIAVIGDSANLASQRLHARLGFREVGTFGAVGFKHGRWLDTVLMQRALGDGSETDPS